MNIVRLIVVSVFFLAFNVFAQASGNAINSTLPIKAADCLIVDEAGNILMVQEVISGKFSIPGGAIIDDESPAMAAIREVYEETGFHISVGDMIARTYNSAIFSCQIKTPTPYFVDETGKRVVMGWSAPHFGKEVKRVLLLPNTARMRNNYRFPEHKWMFPKWVPEVPASDFVLSPGEEKGLTPFYRSQLNALQALHSASVSSRGFIYTSNTLIAFGSLFTPLFFVLSLAFIRAFHGHRALLIYGAGLLGVSFFSLLLSTVIELPRPYFIDPVFGEQDTIGYTLPSMTLALTAFMFCWFVLSWDKEKQPKGRKRLALLGIVVVMLVSGKSLLQGEHFPSDLFVGVLIGVAASFALRRAKDLRFSNRNRVLISARFWLLAFVFNAVIGLWIHKPQIIYLSAICLGTYCSLLCLKIYPIYVSAVRRPAKVTFFALATVGILLLVTSNLYVTGKYAINQIVVAMNCGTAWAIAVLLLVVTPRVFLRLMR
ncbi:phosphatase PAP2 family protein [Enterovibrio sp. ZSDZ42]|uniref:Phosphatase PAP2 family protein n=1 Tax=Enterovibrio gelatinilyticus TaxID=2899819 RepID=A0ABT5R2W9_9GAMM|nr:phosphatase PAP2 family protein [Enterovibrio sp. ZSDZ42]MDD1794615.1 phosphatase PAP2 family protein [Enterovibrio sp. ZSDZ42]